ncbi:MAG: hypothetical protein EPN33_08055 [Acidobacteria bacterium]|nr:MAG: hypothetical protein EPN33_08055 [Acidobacteriota bacterium]
MNRASASAVALPPRPLASAGAAAAALPGWHSWRRRWECLGPDCAEREGLRSWCKLPARIQFQQGWCCGLECLEAAVELHARRLLREHETHAPRPHRIPLGLLLLSHGQITQPQLRAALDAQNLHGGRVGEWLVRQGAASEAAITAAVGLQWARPTFPLTETQAWRQYRGWVPQALLESLGMLPLYFAPASRRLHVGFTQIVDATALAALQTMLECKPLACIVADSAWNAAMEESRGIPLKAGIENVALTDVEGPEEVAAITRQYARVAGAREIRLAAAGGYLWLRLRGQRLLHLTLRPRTRPISL